jgi:hypothetical protein
VAVHLSNPGTAPPGTQVTCEAQPGALAAAAAGDAEDAAVLQPINSNSPDLSKAKGPLAAGRAASWRAPAVVRPAAGGTGGVKHGELAGPLSTGGQHKAGGQQLSEGVGFEGVGGAAGISGLNKAADRTVWHQLFGCLQPPVVKETVGVA